jgi:glutathione synthase/RimK-type ligase-like ATP-grasp enzyme
MQPERFLVSTVRGFCERNAYQLSVKSQGWLLIIESSNRRHLLFGYDLGLNSSAAQQIAGDKSATFEVLAAGGVPAVEHVLFHAPSMRPYVPEAGNWAHMLQCFEAWSSDVVCKSHAGTGGTRVFRAKTQVELEECVQLLFGSGRALTISPYVDFVHECRVIVLDGEARLAYRKERPFVIGDGVSTVAELVGRAADIPSPPKEAAGCRIDFDHVPSKGEAILIEWRHNLAHGATAVIVELDEALSLVDLAVRAADRLNLRFASVDIAETREPLVLEVNAGVMMESLAASSPENQARAVAIYEAALTQVMRM